MELQSARTSLRPWQRQDDYAADAWPPYNDPLDSLWNLPRQDNPDQRWATGFESTARRVWAIEDHAGRLVGRISLREVDEQRARARLGITLGAPFVGHGLGTEALATFLDYYFTELGFQTMVLDVAAPNQRAVRCYERLGFRYVGSDWRKASIFFDTRILSQPNYAHLRRFFRRSVQGTGTEVEFFEMELSKEEWFAWQRGTSIPAP